MSVLNHFAKSDVSELNGEALLREKVVMLNGVNKDMARVLKTRHIETIFDLATSRDFNTVLKMVPDREHLKNGYQNFGSKGFIPKDVLPNDLEINVEELPHLSISKLTFIDREDAKAFEMYLNISTIQEMANWHPFQAARKILYQTFGLTNGVHGSLDPETPSDLLPASGDYPIERVFYKKYFLDSIGNINNANDAQIIPMSTGESQALLKSAKAKLEKAKTNLPIKEQDKTEAQRRVQEMEQRVSQHTPHNNSFKKYCDDVHKAKNLLAKNKINAFCEFIQSERLWLILEEPNGMERFLVTDTSLPSESNAPMSLTSEEFISEVPSPELIKKWKELIDLEFDRAKKMFTNSNDQHEELKLQLEEFNHIAKEAIQAYRNAIQQVDHLTSEVERLKNNEEESKKYLHLEKTGPINMLDSDNLRNGFEEPAVGVEVITAQSWYVEGVALGQLLHSLALAPGESTRIAIVDWHRKEASRTQEFTTQDEQLSSDSQRKRAISEVTEATANELQTGSSFGFSRGGSSQRASNISGGAIFVSGGSSQSSSSNWGIASNVSRTEGSRSVAAETVQNINDAVHQNASSSRTRRAAIVQETFQSENEQVTTRVITNYNHMHAMSVQYYEVIQIYKVKTEVQDLNRILYLPMQYFDFYDIRVINRFQSKLAAGALSARARYLLEAYNDKHVIHFKRPHMIEFYQDQLNAEVQELEDDHRDFLNTTHKTITELHHRRALLQNELFHAEIQASLVWATNEQKEKAKKIRLEFDSLPKKMSELKQELRKRERDYRSKIYELRRKFHTLKKQVSQELKEQSEKVGRVLRTAVPDFHGNNQHKIKSLEGDLRLEEIDFGKQSENQGYTIKGLTIETYPEGNPPISLPLTDGKFILDQGDNPIQDILNVKLLLEKAFTNKNDLKGIPVTLTLRNENNKVVKIKYEFLPPLDTTEIEFLGIEHPVISDELQNHLNDYKQHYSKMVWYQMNNMEYSQLLANVTYQGRKIASFLDPKPVAITGNYIGFRWHFANKTERKEFEDYYSKKTSKNDVTIPLPSGGVFAEAVLGRYNSAEKLDMTRFWNWQDSPIPILPPEIAAVQTGSRAISNAPQAAGLENQAARLNRLQALPDPTGMGAAMNALTMANMFRDMSGSQQVAGMIQNAQQLANQGATSAGEINAENMANFQEYQSGLVKAYLEHTQKMAEVVGPIAMGAATGGAGLAASSLSKAGAVMNMASALDQSSSNGNGEANGQEEAASNGQSNKNSAFQSIIGMLPNIMKIGKSVLTKKPPVG